MALSSHYRWVAVGKLVIRNRVRGSHYAPEFVIDDLIGALKERISGKSIYRLYSSNSRLMWCADIDEDNDYHRLILQVGDKNVSDVSYLHFETLDTRDIEKEENEGGHFAAHVLIRKKTDHLGRHLMLIEKVPGIYLSSLKNHLTWVCKGTRCEKEAQDDDGNSKRFLPVIEIVGHQSRTIREALQTGTLQDIEFISHQESHKDGLDEDPIVEEFVYEARWAVNRRVTEDQARNTFRRIGEYFQKIRGDADYTQIFVRIKAENGQVSRTKVRPNADEILEQAFVQHEIVNEFELPLPSRYKKFHEEMIQKMVEVTRKVGD